MERVKIGWGRREISLDEPVSIAGQFHLRVSEGILDPLYATALCIDGGEGMDSVVFLSTDVATVYGGTIEPLKEAVRKLNPDVPADAIILNATHTHTAPGVGGDREMSPDGRPMFSGDRYREFFIRQCAEAVSEAWQNRKAGGIGYGYGYAVAGHSRRTVYFEEKANLRGPYDGTMPNGYAVMYGTTRDPLFSHFEAGEDHHLNVLFTFDESDKLTGMIVNVPCPSQVGEQLYRLSADYWNEFRTLVAKEFGEEIYVLPQCAAAGDLSPRELLYRPTTIERRMRLKYDLGYDVKEQNDPKTQSYFNRMMAERMEIAGRIFEGVKDIYGWAKKEIFTEVPVRHCYEVMALERRKITDDEKAWCEEKLRLVEKDKDEIEKLTGEEYSKAITIYNSNVWRYRRAIERSEDVKKHPTLDMGAHIVEIGDVAFATIRFELYQDFMHRLQARSPFSQTFVVQLAGEEGGNYLATRRGAAAKGYSASMFCNMVSADGGQQWVENCLTVLNEMKAKEDPSSKT